MLRRKGGPRGKSLPGSGKDAAASAGADGRGQPKLALQGVAPRPRVQLLALALAALEQRVAALPPETLRSASGYNPANPYIQSR